MINEYFIKNWDETVTKKVFCTNKEQAFEKAKIIFPRSWMMINSIKKGRSFKNFNDFLQNRNN